MTNRSDPGTRFAPYTVNTDLNPQPTAFYFGTATDATIRGTDGVTAVFKGALGLLPVGGKITTATVTTDIVAIWN
jgi:hypothetical protein